MSYNQEFAAAELELENLRLRQRERRNETRTTLNMDHRDELSDVDEEPGAVIEPNSANPEELDQNTDDEDPQDLLDRGSNPALPFQPRNTHQFALAPALAEYGVLKYQTSYGIKVYHSGIASLNRDNPFDCEPIRLRSFLTSPWFIAFKKDLVPDFEPVNHR